MTLPANFFHLMHEKGNLSALIRIRGSTVQLLVYFVFALETVSRWIVANRATNIMYETEILVQAVRLNEKGNCGLSLFTCCSK